MSVALSSHIYFTVSKNKIWEPFNQYGKNEIPDFFLCGLDGSRVRVKCVFKDKTSEQDAISIVNKFWDGTQDFEYYEESDWILRG